MEKKTSFYDTVDQIVTYGVQKGILHLYSQDHHFETNSILLQGNDVVNFGSCSYLGLEFDDRLKQGAKDAIDRYGTQFSESRAYVSLGLYQELENLLERIFESPCIVTPTTTLGHMANIPVLVNDNDAVILDHQVHHSVQTSVNLLKARGVYIELLRHNRLDLLEQRVQLLRRKYSKIWYMADGIYSMYGDKSPVDEVYQLLDKYTELYYYVDDAHGMSIFGENGRGSVLNERFMHPKMALAASLNKAFAAGGGVLVYSNREWARKVRTCGGPLITSGPMQPSALGAAIASAKIHLTKDIKILQQNLKDKILFTRLMLKKYGLPLISQSDASIFFIGVSLPKLGYNLVKRMLIEGYYLNLGIFPAVPMKNTGIRFTITTLHTFTQIDEMIQALAKAFKKGLTEENMTVDQIYKAFKMPLSEEVSIDREVTSLLRERLSLQIETYHSIQDVNQSEWNQIFASKGNFDTEGLKFLEEAFTYGDIPENKWIFDYIIVRDNLGKIVVATFCTTTIWKDDMLSPSSISRQVEIERQNTPYHLTSKVLSTGSLLSEGEHLYINISSDFWKEAMQMLLDKISLLQDRYRANQVFFRDFHSENKELDDLMVDNGFFRIAMPDTHKIGPIKWIDKQGFYEGLSKWSKIQFKKKIRRNEDHFIIEFACPGTTSKQDIDHWYALYKNVHSNGFELNTFPLPRKLFSIFTGHPNWEVMVLKLKSAEQPDQPVGVVFSYITEKSYIPMIIGIDYAFNSKFNIYRQALYQITMRGANLGKENIELGFSASIEKMKMGAVPFRVHAYINTKDSFNQEVLATMNTNTEVTYN